MWHWRDKYFKTLREISAEAERSHEWSDYAAFCSEYERGLRKQAFAILNRFISNMERAPFSERKRFVSWLMNATAGVEGQHMAAPHPLRVRIIEPTLVEWTAVEPNCSEPHRWLGGYEHLKSALLLDASDEIARRKLLDLIMGAVDYSTHELPHGYIGDPHEDLIGLAEACELADGMTNEIERKQFAEEIEQQRVLIQSYLNRR